MVDLPRAFIFTTRGGSPPFSLLSLPSGASLSTGGVFAQLSTVFQRGMTVEPVAGAAKMRIGVHGVSGKSATDASEQARTRVRQLLPSDGYKLSEPEPVKAIAS